MANWSVDKLKEILCPLGYECSPLERSVRADGYDYFFEELYKRSPYYNKHFMYAK